jgi:hypothetical protein
MTTNPRRFVTLLLWAVLLLSGLGLSSDANNAGPGDGWVVLQERPVEVSARLRHVPEIALRWYVEWRIVHGDACLSTWSYASGDDSAAVLADLPNDFARRGDYLFIAARCEGGNHWKCSGSEVIAVRDSRLVPLGWLGGADFASYAPDTVWKDGEFLDFDADWESAFTGRGGAPGMDLVLRDSGDVLVADLGRTWQRSMRRYRSNERTWGDRPGVSPLSRAEALFENAVIASYCHRPREFAATMAEAARVVEPAMLRAMRDTLANIRPGVLPRRSRPLSAPCGDRPVRKPPPPPSPEEGC